jgi:hypothetical protein
MALLGGSPLGLVGMKSKPAMDGTTGFNGGKSRNVNVYNYNRSNAGSIFTGGRRLRAWPEIKEINNEKDGNAWDTKGAADVDYEALRKSDGAKGDAYVNNKAYTSFGFRALHNNDVYDTSILNIIEKLGPTKAALRPGDFAYLKNLGVYPNNRLIIVRRFAGPVDSNIMVSRKPTEIPSLATLISWVGEEEDFVDISFGEVWTDARASFTGLLNSLGEDFGKKGFGDAAAAGGGLLPLPGFTEIFQRQFLAKMELLDGDAANTIPAGNPNLIKEAKVRKTVGYDESGSGLTAKVNFKFSTEYELKFISGIDPTMVWMDIIGMVLRFGTSNSQDYGLSGKIASKIMKWANNPTTLLKDIVSGIREAVTNAKEFLTTELNKIFSEKNKEAMKLSDSVEGEEEGEEEEKGVSPRAEALKKNAEEKSLGAKFIEKVTNIGESVIKGAVMKYRTEVLGIVNALTGLPSTPWHITVGNPLRPIYCSGDMYMDTVEIKLGPQLAFNDLPSSIKVEFTLTNARNLGLQEIMARFNSGYLRTVDVQKTYYETGTFKKEGSNDIIIEPPGIFPWQFTPTFPEGATSSGTSSTPGTTGSNVGNTGGEKDTKPGNTQSTANSQVKLEGGKGSDKPTIEKDATKPQPKTNVEQIKGTQSKA